MYLAPDHYQLNMGLPIECVFKQPDIRTVRKVSIGINVCRTPDHPQHVRGF